MDVFEHNVAKKHEEKNDVPEYEQAPVAEETKA